MISHWLGWVAAGDGVLALFIYFVRKNRSNNKRLWYWFCGKHHHIWGELVLIVGILHGILAVIWGFEIIATKRFAVVCITGLISLTAVLLLAVTALKPQGFGKKWFCYHRFFAGIVIIAVLLHISSWIA